MSKKFGLFALTVLLVSAFATAASADINWKAYEGTTLNVMFNEHTYAQAIIAKLADFEKLTGIKVIYSTTPETNYFDKLNTALSSRTGDPDIFMTGAYQTWEYAPAGYMEDLDPYIKDGSKTSAAYKYDDFIPGIINALRWDLVPGHAVGKGKLWALPMGWEINTLTYNKKIFEAKGRRRRRPRKSCMTFPSL